MQRIADRVGKRIGAFGRAVDDDQLFDAGVEQSERRGPRRAAGAEQQTAAAAQVQTMALGKITDQAGAVGVVAAPAVAARAKSARRCIRTPMASS